MLSESAFKMLENRIQLKCMSIMCKGESVKLLLVRFINIISKLPFNFHVCVSVNMHLPVFIILTKIFQGFSLHAELRSFYTYL